MAFRVLAFAALTAQALAQDGPITDEVCQSALDGSGVDGTSTAGSCSSVGACTSTTIAEECEGDDVVGSCCLQITEAAGACGQICILGGDVTETTDPTDDSDDMDMEDEDDMDDMDDEDDEDEDEEDDMDDMDDEDEDEDDDEDDTVTRDLPMADAMTPMGAMSDMPAMADEPVEAPTPVSPPTEESPAPIPAVEPPAPTPVPDGMYGDNTMGGYGDGEQERYGQCGGVYWTGPTGCAAGLRCEFQNDYYSQCLPDPDAVADGVMLYEQCGGRDYTGPTKCAFGARCVAFNEWYSQCRGKY